MRPPAKTTPTAALCLTLLLLATCAHAPVDQFRGTTLVFEIRPTQSVSPEAESKLVSDTIKVLKRRLDPLGESNFQFKRMGEGRIEIRIPNSAQIAPDEVTRVATAGGVVEFRIAVDPTELANDPESVRAAKQGLAKDGPSHSVVALGTRVRWMQIATQGRDNFKHGFVIENWSGEPYVLCYDDQLHTLTHEPKRLAWSVTAGTPFGTKWGYVLPFALDAAGAKYMGQLTSDNLHQAMAILLDDQAMSAPMIQSRIEDKAEISFGQNRSPEDTKREANDLRQIMNAGVLPARLIAVSPSSTSPSTLPSR